MRIRIVMVMVVALVALPSSAIAAGKSVIAGGGAINTPDIAAIFPGQSPWFSFTVVARQTSPDGAATGHMSGEVFDWYRVDRHHVQADVDCILIDGDRAVAWGHVTNADPTDPLFWWFQYFAIVTQRMPDGSNLTNIVPQYLLFPPTESCQLAVLDQFWGFIGYETRGAVTIH